PRAEALLEAALEAEAAALAVPGLSKVQGAGAGWGREHIHLAATNGFSAGYARSSWSVSAMAITGEGLAMERDWAAEARLHRADLPDPASIGRLAGERAAARAGARKPPTGSFPVLYDERVAAGLIGHLLAAVNGAAIARGSSWLRDALGQPVLPAGLSLIEEPRRVRGPASRPFDAEGLATSERAIIDRGVLTGWTLDLATAAKLGMRSTANAVRGTGAPPSPGVSNIRLTQGEAGREDLIRDMGRGLVVTSLIGATINPNTGDYSRGASGFWVEGGEIAYPVNECTIAGNLREILARIVPANDARPHRAHQVPSLLVDGLTIAGA
ncbi:MAG: TldD/PmbA family protein, partial [Alphaproteobacteria bacterium]